MGNLTSKNVLLSSKKSSKSTQKFHISVQSKVKSSVKIFIDLYLIVDVLNFQLVYCPILIKIVSNVDLVCLFLHHFKRYFRVFVLFPTNVQKLHCFCYCSPPKKDKALCTSSVSSTTYKYIHAPTKKAAVNTEMVLAKLIQSTRRIIK